MLTKEQKKIIDHKKDPALAKAGPGTGKTHVLCCRVESLINKGVPPGNIVLLTFSKDAALNMETRLADQFCVDNVRCSTTHSFGLSIVREYSHELGFTARPEVKIKQLNKQLGFIIKKVAAQNKVDGKKLQNAVYRATKDGKIDSRGNEEV